ncbi:recombinase family protein [Mycoplasmatota bacterium zrk1]
MARKSRKKLKIPVMPKKTALYVRLSNEDGSNESIESQKSILLDYIQDKQELVNYKFYVDNGVSGTTFDRRGFTKMYSDITDNKINAVVVKDLSRFGRNFVEVGRYIETIFPHYKVRFISVNDNFDTKTSSGDNLFLTFQNLFHDRYAKEISYKRKIAVKQMFENGIYTASIPPYGYLISKEPKRHLVVDEYAKKIVKNIFDSYLKGKKISEICKSLNNKGILAPQAYKHSIGLVKKEASPNWTRGKVRDILGNYVYTGGVVHANENTYCGKYVQRKLAEDEKQYYENTHEAIIDIDSFNIVQRIRNKKHIENSIRFTKSNHLEQQPIFKGKLLCKQTGLKFNVRIRNESNKQYYKYFLDKDTARGITKGKSIKESILLVIIKNDLPIQVKLVDKYKDIIKDYTKSKRFISLLSDKEKRIEELKIQKKIQVEDKISLYGDYKDGLLDTDAFQAQLKELNIIIDKIDISINELETEYTKVANIRDVCLDIKKIKIDITDEDIITNYISKIEMGIDRDIFITYSFTDTINQFVTYIGGKQ